VEVRPGYREALLQLVASSDEELLASSTSPAHEDAFFSSEMRRFYQWQLDHYGQTLEEAEFMWDPDSGRWVEYQGAAT